MVDLKVAQEALELAVALKEGGGGGDSVPGKNVVIHFDLTPASNLSGVID